MEDTANRSVFMSSLQDDLEMAWLVRQEPLCAKIKTGEGVAGYYIKEKEISPERVKGG